MGQTNKRWVNRSVEWVNPYHQNALSHNTIQVWVGRACMKLRSLHPSPLCPQRLYVNDLPVLFYCRGVGFVVGMFSAGWLLPAGNCVRIYMLPFLQAAWGYQRTTRAVASAACQTTTAIVHCMRDPGQPTEWLVPLNLLLFINRIDMIVDEEYAMAGSKSVLGNCISRKGTHRNHCTPAYPVRHSV